MEVPDLLINVWYLADGTLCGSSADILKALNIIEGEGPSRGLFFLNMNKSLLFAPEDDKFSQNLLSSDIPTTRDGFVLLGSFVGLQSFCSSMLVVELGKFIPLLPDLEQLIS